MGCGFDPNNWAGIRGAHAPSRVGVGTLADANFCFIETTDFTDCHG